ncbi:MAG: SDR family oxidoreductase [Candidatus Aminicenantes bacterium]|nr:SDR family oxidoreductase [Candidatus Aminicenantes bacterium]
MDFGIQDKVALVAASSLGLGKAAALELSKEGAIVNICARSKDRLVKTREELQSQTGNEVRAWIADVTEKDQVHDMIQKIISEFGKIDILVSNAGGPPSGQIDDFSPADYLKALELNLMTTINLCYSVIPSMKANLWGRIINIASISGKQPIDTLVLSNTARAGVLGFSKSLSNQMAPYGVTVNSVCPGYTKTERINDLAEAFVKGQKGSVQDFFNKIASIIPAGRLATTEEFGATVAFLASQQAGYITGTALQIDGGLIKALY